VTQEQEERRMQKKNFLKELNSTPNPLYVQKIEVKLSLFHKIEE